MGYAMGGLDGRVIGEGVEGIVWVGRGDTCVCIRLGVGEEMSGGPGEWVRDRGWGEEWR